MLTKEAVENYRCPRWDDLPDLPLYMDQVVMVVQGALGIFAVGQEPVVTSTMVNNYVKQGLIDAPVKKKYERRQFTRLIVLSLFKRVFSMNEINGVISSLTATYGRQQAYDMFCQRLEDTLKAAFGGVEYAVPRTPGIRDTAEVLDVALTALVSKLVVQGYLEGLAPPNADEAAAQKAKKNKG